MTTTMTVHVGKLNESFSVEVAAGSDDYLRQYGLNQAVNDAHASVQRKGFDSDAKYESAVREKVEARLEQIRTGNVPNLRGPAPITTEAAAKKLAETMGMSPEEVLKLIQNAQAKKRPAA